MRALAIAATGMTAQEQNIEVIAHNVANINTTGFKRSRAEFTDLIYQNERLQGVSSRGRDATVPEGAQFGLGVRTAAVRSVNIQGALTSTGNTLDLAINGRGWFQVTTANGDTVYTRDGAFNTNAQGQLVTSDGLLVTPNVVIPPTATSVNVNQSGLVTATIAGQTTAQTLGQLTVANFVNDAGLLLIRSPRSPI
jgi:flagellar basal-body rod protein FlgG